MSIPPPYAHQEACTQFWLDNPRMLNWSDPGTGKTRESLDSIVRRGSQKRILAICPLSIVASSWLDDCHKFTPDLTADIAYAKNREAVFKGDAQLVITNHDAVKWLFENRKYLNDFDSLVVDEAPAFKHVTSQRTKALMQIRHFFEYRNLMSGTPGTQSLLDLWAPAFIADDGERLGNSYYKFRSQTMDAFQVGPDPQMREWREREGAADTVAMALSPISIRYRKEDCIDIPEQQFITMNVDLPPSVRKIYNQMVQDSVVFFKDGRPLNAINAGARAIKLLQICTGAVYDNENLTRFIDSERYRMVIDLIAARPWPCLVAYSWRHELDELCKHARAAGLRFECINGSVPVHRRTEIVAAYQRGELDCIFAHPASASHGLTLTRGKTTIWTNPTANAEHFLQFNARQHRAGQTERTEVIMIAGRDTREEHLYDILQGKTRRVANLLSLFVDLQQAA